MSLLSFIQKLVPENEHKKKIQQKRAELDKAKEESSNSIASVLSKTNLKSSTIETNTKNTVLDSAMFWEFCANSTMTSVSKNKSYQSAHIGNEFCISDMVLKQSMFGKCSYEILDISVSNIGSIAISGYDGNFSIVSYNGNIIFEHKFKDNIQFISYEQNAQFVAIALANGQEKCNFHLFDILTMSFSSMKMTIPNFNDFICDTDKNKFYLIHTIENKTYSYDFNFSKTSY